MSMNEIITPGMGVPQETGTIEHAKSSKSTNINSTELQKRVLMLRLDGYSIRAVGEMVECCYQSIANYLRELENSKTYTPREMAPYHEMTKDEMEAFCDACVKGKGKAKNISSISGLPIEKVYSALDYVTTRKPMPCRDSVYPKLAEWMRHQCVTMHVFSDEVGIPQSKLRSLMSGREHMTMELAEKINKFTGLSLADIFSEQIPSAPRKKKGGPKSITEVPSSDEDDFTEYDVSGAREDVPQEEPLVIPNIERGRSRYQKPPTKKTTEKE